MLQEAEIQRRDVFSGPCISCRTKSYRGCRRKSKTHSTSGVTNGGSFFIRIMMLLLVTHTHTHGGRRFVITPSFVQHTHGKLTICPSKFASVACFWNVRGNLSRHANTGRTCKTSHRKAPLGFEPRRQHCPPKRLI